MTRTTSQPDFGGVSVALKINYHDQDLCFHSPDAADPEVTKRVITVMRLDEYWTTDASLGPLFAHGRLDQQSIWPYA